MADLKQIDEYEEALKEQMNLEFDYFPMEEFKNAGIVINENDPVLKSAADAELFNIEQVLQQQQPEKRAPSVSHMHRYQHDKHSKQDEGMSEHMKMQVTEINKAASKLVQAESETDSTTLEHN